MKKIVGRLKRGVYPDHFGLANQMFQISMAYAYAKRNNLKPVFPELRQTNVCGPYLETVFRNLDTSGMIADFEGRHVKQNETDFQLMDIPDGLEQFMFDGYWQSEHYFKDCASEIKELFSVDPQTEKRIKEKYEKELSKPCCSIHMRRGDYLNYKDVFVNLVETNYYQDAVNESNAETFFVMSNDVDFATEWFAANFPEKNMIFPNDDEVFEMYLMSMCDEVIMANSSFSWWGSYLGKEKKTFAPKEWFMPNSIVNYESIYRDDWRVL